MDVVVCAERNDFLVRGYVVHNASSDAVDIEVVGIHECHTSEKEDSSADFAQGLV